MVQQTSFFVGFHCLMLINLYFTPNSFRLLGLICSVHFNMGMCIGEVVVSWHVL